MKNLLFGLLVMLYSLPVIAQVTVDNDPSLDYQKDLADRTNFDKINFSIQSPLHFVIPDTGFIGFIHPGLGGSIAIVEIPFRSASNVADEFQSKDFESADSKLIESSSFLLESGKEGKLFKVHFVIQEQLVERLVLIIGTDKKTYMIYANYPALVAPVINPVIISSFKTALFEE